MTTHHGASTDRGCTLQKDLKDLKDPLEIARVFRCPISTARLADILLARSKPGRISEVYRYGDLTGLHNQTRVGGDERPSKRRGGILNDKA